MPSPAEVIIGLDVGTTGVKAVAFAPGQAWRSLARRDCPPLQGSGGEEVQDPATILAAAGAALEECASATDGAVVLAICVSTAMHGLIGLDSERRPLTPLITWADARASAQARELRASDVNLHALTGVPVHPMAPLAKLAWFATNDPATLARARWWVGLKELVLGWLTGVVCTELSSASGTGMLDLKRRAWSETAVALAGIRSDQLAEIRPPTGTLPLASETAARVGLARGTPVVLGAGDGPLGNLGTGAIAPGGAGMSLGTSGAVRIALEQPAVDAAGTLFCYALTDALWVLGSAISTGGAVLGWIDDVFATEAPPDRGTGAEALALAAQAPPGCDGLVMLPYLLTERGPLWDPDVRGAYLGLRREHGRAHLARAAIEGVCIQMRLILDRLEQVASVSSIRATGGVFRSELWREVMAAMVGRPFELSGEEEGTAAGAAALGLFALGRAASLADALALLSGDDGPRPIPVTVDRELAGVYDRVRATIPSRIAELDTLSRAFGSLEPAATVS